MSLLCILNQSLNISVQRSAYCTLIFIILAMSSVIIGCEDPPANDPPTVIGSSTYARCERVEGEYGLSEIQFVIEDLQGSDTLVIPYVSYRNVSIEMTESTIPAATTEEISAAKEAGMKINACSKESCQMQYSWDYDRNDEASGLIRCEVNEAQVLVVIKDFNGNAKNFKINVLREE